MKEMKLVFEVPDTDGTHRKVEYEKKRIVYLCEKRSK